MVVINGDRAGWIRKGLEYFPRAMYQVDRFHLKRDLRTLLRGTQELYPALAGLERNKPALLLAALGRRVRPGTENAAPGSGLYKKTC